MTKATARLLLVFSLAFVATMARGKEDDRSVPAKEVEQAQWAAFGFAGPPQPPGENSPKIIYSDEEVVVVDPLEQTKP